MSTNHRLRREVQITFCHVNCVRRYIEHFWGVAPVVNTISFKLINYKERKTVMSLCSRLTTIDASVSKSVK